MKNNDPRHSQIVIDQDSQLVVAEKIVKEWSSLFMGKVANEAAYENLIKRVATALAAERERCANIALAIDSGRGNEKEIAAAIRNPITQVPGTASGLATTVPAHGLASDPSSVSASPEGSDSVVDQPLAGVTEENHGS